MIELVSVGVAAIVILGGFFTVWIVYEKCCLSQNGQERSFILYILGCLFSAFLGGGIANSFALEIACSGNAGTGCAFGVVALLFPFACTIGIAIFLLIWSNQGQHVTKN
ncbi:hypothetical protein [Dechloromonas sp. CZR5]|uniref:hypothetical protein n=1 Tax=Dechloromonas sp. CZR5 TaxID=2608630 RepID=UPI00123C9EBB|nr:hypothetical protein [Dechloromonas sp. CZR5]